jgi:hypothetical protein
MLTFTHSFTEGLKATAYGGPRLVSSTTEAGGFSQKTNDTIWIYGATLTQQFEKASLQLSVSRDIFPSGFGLLLQTDRLGALTSFDITDTITASLDTSGYIVSGVTNQARGGILSEQRFLYVTPKLSWHFSEWWRIEASYAYRWRDAVTLDEPVTSNMLMFMLTYYPPKLTISN